MAIKTVAIIGTGDMGHAVGWMLKGHGLRVVTCLQGRSPRSRRLAEAAGIEDLPSLEALVRQSDVFLSIVPPDQAVALAEEMRTALLATGRLLLYVDGNAVSPQTARQIAAIITAAGGRYVDGGIIGPPPTRPGTTRFYVSGPEAGELMALNGSGIEFLSAGEDVTAASALKMCYAAISKGTAALWFESLVTAETLGVAASLYQELRRSQAEAFPTLERQMPGIPPKAWRWVSEMEEIAATFAQVGLTPKIFEGAADLYRFISTTPLANESPETVDRSRKVPEIIAALREHLDALRTA